MSWVIARTDWFGPTIYYAHDSTYVWGKDASEARVYSDPEKASQPLPDGAEWKPATDLALEKAAELAG